MKLAVAALLSAISIQPVAAQDHYFEIKRIFQSSSSFTTIVISIPVVATIKCAVYDSDQNPLRVETSNVTPPLDEILIRTGDSTSRVKSAECWRIE